MNGMGETGSRRLARVFEAVSWDCLAAFAFWKKKKSLLAGATRRAFGIP